MLCSRYSVSCIQIIIETFMNWKVLSCYALHLLLSIDFPFWIYHHNTTSFCHVYLYYIGTKYMPCILFGTINFNIYKYDWSSHTYTPSHSINSCVKYDNVLWKFVPSRIATLQVMLSCKRSVFMRVRVLCFMPFITLLCAVSYTKFTLRDPKANKFRANKRGPLYDAYKYICVVLFVFFIFILYCW